MRWIRPLAIGAVLALLAWPTPAAGQTASGLHVTTPYPAVTVAPGESVTFDIDVAASAWERVDLQLAEVPTGWDAILRGGGFLIGGVFTDAEGTARVELEVRVPTSAEPGSHRIVVLGSSAVGADRLELDLRVSRVEVGGVSLTTDFPRLQGPAGATYRFDLQLSNDTPRDAVFDLRGAGPAGWQVTVKPAGQELATSVEVAAGSSTSLSVEVDPPDQTPAGVYPVVVRAAGGGAVAQAKLAVRIIGNYGLTLTTPDERLNADVAAGKPTEVPLVVVNDGTAPLREVDLSATSPTGWTTEFRPEQIPEIAPGDSARVVAIITPSKDAVAGDYIVTLRATAAETNDEIDLRTTVRTSAAWGLVGVALIVAAIAGLGLLFRRYGRR
jgi:uncharacterized membrane protein